MVPGILVEPRVRGAQRRPLTRQEKAGFQLWPDPPGSSEAPWVPTEAPKVLQNATMKQAEVTRSEQATRGVRASELCAGGWMLEGCC